jgi:hypothetical protein
VLFVIAKEVPEEVIAKGQTLKPVTKSGGGFGTEEKLGKNCQEF